MLEEYGDIWEHADDYDAIVITTNGFVKQNGEAVMGRGIAKQAKEKYPWLPKLLGGWIIASDNMAGIFTHGSIYPKHIITMPVKPILGPNGEPGWKAKADICLIKESARITAINVNDYEIEKIIMPRPGCGNGGLKWEDVKPIIEPIFDDRFTVMEYK